MGENIFQADLNLVGWSDFLLYFTKSEAALDEMWIFRIL